jgi:hypothetical protein
MMEGRILQLEVLSTWLLIASVVTFAAGVGYIACTPCREYSSYLALPSLVLALVAACVMFVRAVVRDTAGSWSTFAGVLLVGFVEFSISYCVLAIHCRAAHGA